MAEEMRLEKELTVGVPLDRAWRTLSDPETFASCLPDADLRPVDGVYAGRATLGADGNRIVCETTLRALDQDEDEHVATILLHARQVGGPGLGSATLQSRCESADSATRVTLSAEVVASGHEQSGEAFERAARTVFDELGERLEQHTVAAPPPSAPVAPPVVADEPEPSSALTKRGPETGLAMVVAALLAIVLVRWLLGRRRGGLW